MLNPKFFPTIMIILNVCAAGVYALHGWPEFPEWRKVIYWLAAAVLTVVVTY